MNVRRTRWTLVCLVSVLVTALGALLPLGARIAYGQAASPGDLVHGPYVSAVSQTGARVQWVAPAGAEGACQIEGDPVGAKVETMTSPITGRPEVCRTAVVTGLAPGQAYKYVVTAGKARAEGAFRTAPPAGSREPFTFLTYSDPQTSPSRHKSVAGAILREPAPAFALITGDLTDDGPDWAGWGREFFSPARDLLRRQATWTLRGNHERDGVTYKELFRQSGDAPHVSFDYGNLHVVLLDQYKDKAEGVLDDAGQAALVAWLEKDLAASKAEWKIVCYHEPTFNVGGHGSTWGRTDALPVMLKHGVDVVLCGHSHVYERFVPIGPKGGKPLVQLVASGGGGTSYDVEPSPILAASYSGLHYGVFSVHGDRLEVTAKSPDGNVIDRWSLVKTNGVYQKEVMDAAIATEDAIPLTKVFKTLPADYAARPKAGEALAVTLNPGLFPKGCQVRLASDPNGPWKVKETAFEDAGLPVPLAVTPPAGIVLDENRYTAPLLTISVSLDNKGHKYQYPSVPVQMTVEALRRLVPPPEPASVPAAKAALAIDGNLADWKDVPYLALPSTKAASKDFQLAWRADGLYGAVAVAQKDIKPNPEKLAEGDGLELFVEADAQRRLRADSKGTPMRLFLLPQAGKDGGEPLIRRLYGRRPKEPMQAAWTKTAQGYTIEFCIPTKQLTTSRLAAGRKMGFHFVLRRGGQVIEQFADTRGFRTVAYTPAYWGAIQLAE